MSPFLRAMLAALLVAITIGLAGCNNSTDTVNADKPDPVETEPASAAELIAVHNPVIRATAPGQSVSGAFMTLVNNSNTDYALTSVSFSAAGMVEIHETSMKNEMMRMRMVNQIDIPANGSAELKPGSYHIMLMGLEKEMKAGTSETLTLTFSDNSEKTIEALVGTLNE